MKNTTSLSGLALLLALLLSMLPCAAGLAEGPLFEMLGQQCEVVSVQVNPDSIINEAPDVDQYVYIRLRSTTGAMALFDIMDVLEYIMLEDADEELYYALAYMPYTMAYSARNGVFTTSPEQTTFSVLFIVPAGQDVKDMVLYADMGEVGLWELPDTCFE